MPARSRRYPAKRSMYRSKGSRHQTALQVTTSSIVYAQSDNVIVPAMITGEEARGCGPIKFQIGSLLSMATFTASVPIGWGIQYVPAGYTPQNLAFDQSTTGTLAASNQFILNCGIFETGNAPNAFYSRGHKLDDGDAIYISLQPLAPYAIQVNAVFSYTITVK